tara:strand:+ start:1943 stop:2248 length:306 start_codon:yes stop_codon:yes gene_type:complete
MKNFFLLITIFFLIISTTLVKNSTKKIENQIFTTKENLSILNDKYKFVLLDFNYLTAPQKLFDYHLEHFDKELSKIDITDVKELFVKNKEIIIRNFNKIPK